MSALGQQQTSNPVGVHVRSALNSGSQLLTVETSAARSRRSSNAAVVALPGARLQGELPDAVVKWACVLALDDGPLRSAVAGPTLASSLSLEDYVPAKTTSDERAAYRLRLRWS